MGINYQNLQKSLLKIFVPSGGDSSPNVKEADVAAYPELLNSFCEALPWLGPGTEIQGAGMLLYVVGLILFLLGIFAPLSFWDFFVLTGPIIIFLSLVFWIFWYLGNLTVPYQQLLPK
ncbi:hypothetical protein AOLI_G00318620 [Acnodon oligacanthus]